MLLIDHRVVDSDLDFLKEVLALLDTKIADLDLRAQRTTDPVSDGICDHYEEVCGLGFVASQRYLAAVCGWYRVKKKMAIKMGPQVAWNLTIAQTVNNAANYWKHKDEWYALTNSETDKIGNPLEPFGDSIGYDYPLSCILSGLGVRPCRLACLLPRLEEWREEIRRNPNQPPEPTPTAVTPAASAPVAPAVGAAHL